MLLLPPSEGKATGGDTRRPAWTPDAGTFARLGVMRAEVAAALTAVDGGDEKLLGVKGDHLLRSRSANSSLIGAPTLPAWQRYTGVVWDHLDPATLPPTVRRHIVVVSGLLGLVRADDPTPEYRLKMAANLVPLGKMSNWWREAISTELARTARRRVVIDLLPQEHRAAIVLDGLEGVTVALVDPSGKPGGHAAKAAKGELARAILTDGVGALDVWSHPRFRLDITPFGPSGGA